MFLPLNQLIRAGDNQIIQRNPELKHLSPAGQGGHGMACLMQGRPEHASAEEARNADGPDRFQHPWKVHKGSEERGTQQQNHESAQDAERERIHRFPLRNEQ